MNQTAINILENIWVGALGLFLLIFSGLGVWHVASSSNDTPPTMHHSDVLADHNERLLKLDDLQNELGGGYKILDMYSEPQSQLTEASQSLDGASQFTSVTE